VDEDLRHAARQTPDRCAVGGVEAPGAQDLPPTPGGCGPPCACSACLCMRCALPAHDSCGAGMVLLLVAMPHVHDFGCASQRVRFQPCGLSLPTLERRSPRSPRVRRGAASTPGGRARALRRHAAEAAGGLPEPYRLRAVGHSLGGAALLIYAVMCRKLGRPHHIYRLILLTPAGFPQKLPLVQNPAPDPETPAEAACPQPLGFLQKLPPVRPVFGGEDWSCHAEAGQLICKARPAMWALGVLEGVVEGVEVLHCEGGV